MPISNLYIFNQALTSVLLVRQDASSIPLLPQIKIDGDDLNKETLRATSKWLNIKTVVIFTSDIGFSNENIRLHLGVIVDSDHIITQELAEWHFITSDTNKIINNNGSIVIKKFLDSALKKQKISGLLTIQKALKKSQDFLITSRNILKDEWGWDHNLDVTKRIGIIGTSLGILTLSCFPPSSTIDLFYRTANTLVKKQLPAGGWGTRSMSDGDVPVVHSTAYALLALSSLGIQDYKSAIEKGVTWLNRAQRNGAWGVDAQSESQLVTPTTLSVIALSKIEKVDNKLINNSINWLENAQYPNGGWGAMLLIVNLEIKNRQRPILVGLFLH